MKNIFLSALSFFFPLLAIAQEEEEIPVLESKTGFYFGINTGACLANKYTAGYYGGTNEYSLVDLISNPYVKNELSNKFQQLPFWIGEYPAQMRYKPGIAAGFHFGYYTDETSAFFMDVNFVRLTLAATFAIYTDDPNNMSGDPIVYPEILTGEENRLSIDLGYHSDFGEEKVRGYAEFGGNFNAVKPVKNTAIIEGLQYNLLQNGYYLQPWIDRGGMGFGFFLGTGVRMKFNQKFTFDLGATANFQRINLWMDEKFKLNPVLYLRLLYL
ncbi:MAG: hypothetical protein ACOZCO_09085 [Bacteroidota bacterium]